MRAFFLALFFVYGTAAMAAEPKLSRSDFMTGLESPWDLAFTSDGAMFFTEKCKGLSVRKPDGKVVHLFGTDGAAVVASDLLCEGQSGVQGIALDPKFSENRTIFMYMSSKLDPGPRTNRVLRMKVNEAYSAVSDRKDIISDIPYKAKGNSWGGPGGHSGGRLRFSPSGHLFVTTGDNHNGFLPQDLSRLGGKVLRVDRDGKGIQGNIKNGDNRIYTYGHRNVQGIAFRPRGGQPYACEHGPNHDDEITPLVAGGNGGWDPKPEPSVKCKDDYCGYTSNKPDGSPTPMTDLKKFPDAMKPLLALEDSNGMGPCTFVTGSQWKDWNGALLVGIMQGLKLDVVRLGKDGELLSKTSPSLASERFRSLVQGPKGDLFVATDGGSIWRLSPK